ncbi:MAG: DUF5666 domain-containing protein [Thermoleophilia bacterium]
MATEKNGKNIIGIGIVAILAVGGGMFFAGMKYGQSRAAGTTGPAQSAGRGNFRGGAGRNGQNGGFTSGTILSMDNQSITVKMRSGGSKTIYYSGSTQVGQMDRSSVSDLKTGDQVLATGTSNPDGSIAARDIEVTPAGSSFIPGGRRGGGQSGSGGGQSGNGGGQGGGSGNGG